ncbi:MAG: primosomal protein N', partial [Calditrichaeota bacterium]|nr:primosomal protein N' [Calditrichota bacterium]
MLNPSEITLGEVQFGDHPAGGYTYRIPSDLNITCTGIRVKVPFGRQRRVGILTSIYEGPDHHKYRNIAEPIDITPLISPEILELTEWIADYYLCEWGEALSSAIPRGLKPTGKRKYILTELGLSEPFLSEESGPAGKLWRELRKSPLTYAQINRRLPRGALLIEKFKRQGWIEQIETEVRRSVQNMITEWCWNDEHDYSESLDTLPKNAKRLRRCVEILQDNDGRITAKELTAIESGMSPIMRNLVKKGWVSSSQVPARMLSSLQGGLAETAVAAPILSPEQQNLVDQIEKSIQNGKYNSFLLHGVTSSGKTIVYLEAVAKALELGGSAIVMVPEISLTPQLTGRFRRRFGEDVVVTHSGLSEAERREAWNLARLGKAKVLVGPRSVVFTPLQNIKLIVIDEEHDDSYKQADPAPRYNGRDVALYRAFKSGATVILGSATPDIVSYNNARQNRHQLLELKERHGEGSLPDVWVVKWSPSERAGCFHPKLKKRLGEVVESGEQAILLINRRGFSTVIRCPDCGDVAKCPNCDITLRYHRDRQLIECHYCGHSQKPLDTCPNCRSQRLIYAGIGTQRVERELELYLPNARVLRMDQDTTHRKGAHQQILTDFADHKYDILLGTQMVAKGHDFPNVTLVGILLADMEWWRSDFRANERAYRLLSQAAGRTGRAGGGEVVIQALEAEHSLLRWVQKHDYGELFRSEIEDRKELNYPPYSKLIAVTLKSEDCVILNKTAFELKDALDFKLAGCKILGPAPPPVERIEKQYRRRLLIKIPLANKSMTSIKDSVKEAVRELERQYKSDIIRISVDVDP